MTPECHMLIAERDDYLRVKIAGVLSMMNRVSSVSQASDNVEMASAIEKYVPTLLLIDLKMAVENKTLLEKIKQKSPLVKIFVMSNHQGPHRDTEGLVKADSYFLKSNIVYAVSRLLDETQCASLTA